MMLKPEEMQAQLLEWEYLGDDLLAFLNGQMDVLDGSDGNPVPNEAMQLVRRIKNLLGMEYYPLPGETWTRSSTPLKRITGES
jgi:hypothetical protein